MRPLTVADAIQTTRLMQSPEPSPPLGEDFWGVASQDGVFVSPDGRRYVLMLIRGDLERNGNWVELLAGELDSLDSAASPQSVARLFTDSLGSADPAFGRPELTWPRRNPPVWLEDNERVVFYWHDDRNNRQVVAVNVRTKVVDFLTRHPTDVRSFHLSSDGTLLYAAAPERSRERSDALLRDGFAVPSGARLTDLIRGDVDGYGALDRANDSEWFVTTVTDRTPRKINFGLGGVDRATPPLFRAAFSADGSQALLVHTPTNIPSDWDRYTHPMIKRLVTAQRTSPDSLAVRHLKQLFVVDLRTANARLLWSAPAALDLKAAWSPNGRSVLLGPTFIPGAAEGSAGLGGKAVAEVDVAAGRYWLLPWPADVAQAPVDPFEQLRWIDSDEVEAEQGGVRIRFKKARGRWRLVNREAVPAPGAQNAAAARSYQSATGTSAPSSQPAASAPSSGASMTLASAATDSADSAAAGGEQATPSRSTIRVEVRQDLDSPPVVFAVDTATGEEKPVRDLNPQLRGELMLGRVEHVHWNDKAGREWSGLLYYPVDYTKDRRFPLVIQTHGHAPPTEFSLYGYGSPFPGTGPGLGPGYSVYAAQPLANRNIAVLQVEDKRGLSEINATPHLEAEIYMGAYESAVEHFVASGLADRSKIGLVGFSRTGWHVEYTLTHSDFPFAAAIVSDNFNAGYMQAALSRWEEDYASANGAPPFGEGLLEWLKRAPPFNAERVRTPLRLQVESGGLSGALMDRWEMYSRLVHLKKPVELYIIPDIQHGSHGLQNPRQCLASQQGAVDWFDFWLNGYDDSRGGKAEQYARWRTLWRLYTDQQLTQQPQPTQVTQPPRGEPSSSTGPTPR